MAESSGYTTISLSPSSLLSQPWWPAVHSMITKAFLSKDHSVFPPSWTRLNSDPSKGGKGLIDELGDNGIFVVIFNSDNRPVACTGALPFRGENWINDVDGKINGHLSNGDITAIPDVSSSTTSDISDWETCCFCVDHAQRKRGLARRLLKELETLIKPLGAKRLVSNYAVDETGDFWQIMGFEVIPGAGGMLPKGFQHDPDKEGLRADIHFNMGAKRL